MMLEKFFLGNLSWNVIPWDDPVTLYGAGSVLGFGVLAVLLTLTLTKSWGYIWKEWICKN